MEGGFTNVWSMLVFLCALREFTYLYYACRRLSLISSPIKLKSTFFGENVKKCKDLWSAATQRWHVFGRRPMNASKSSSRLFRPLCITSFRPEPSPLPPEPSGKEDDLSQGR